MMRGAPAPNAAEGRHADLKKLRANIAEADAKDPTFTKPRVVLLSTGSFSPLHRYLINDLERHLSSRDRMHVHVFEAAKKMLEKKNFYGAKPFSIVCAHRSFPQSSVASFRPLTMTTLPVSSATRPSRPCIVLP